MFRIHSLAPIALSALLFCSCDDSASSGNSSASLADMKKVEGIYKLSAYTHNVSECSSGTDSLSQMEDTYAVMAVNSSDWGDYLTVALCPSVEDCASMGQAIRSGEIYFAQVSANFSRGSLSKGFTSSIISTGFWRNDGTCTDANQRDINLSVDGQTFSYEEKVRLASTFPHDEEGYCTTDDAQKYLGSCTQMRTMQGSFVQVLE